MDPETRKRGLRTKAVHAGDPHPPIGDAVAMPIFQSSTYLHRDETGYDDIRYTRLNNTPNHDAVAATMAALEETEAALVAGSGMAAISAALLAHLRQGDHLIAQDCLYGGTRHFIEGQARDLGIETTFVSLENPDRWRRALRAETRAFYVESITNPLLDVGRLDEVAAFAREHALLSMIDNTFPTPVHFRPAGMGYDVVLHSATKYLNGHSDVLAGVAAGSSERIAPIRSTLNLMGGCLDPLACYLLHRGLKTLPLRVRAQSDNAAAIAALLAEHGAVEMVRYPGLDGDPAYERARAWFDGCGGMVTFTPRGGMEAARRILDRLTIPHVAPSLGGVETLVTRPAATSHAAIAPEVREELGIASEMIRISVGIEEREDLLADFIAALE